MRSYNKYINDPYFMKWIFQPDDLSERYWKDFIKDNPEEEKLILLLKNDLSKLKLKNKELSETDKRFIYQNILKETRKNNRVVRFKKKVYQALPYAAVALLFLILGNVFMYLHLENGKSTDKFNYSLLEYTFPGNQPKLVLADGTDVNLDRHSSVDCLNEKVVVDNKKLIIPPPNASSVTPNQLIVPNGSTSRITLSDHTVVYLNAGSKLIYPSNFDSNSREVLLIGEAYFKVTKNKHKPFIVKTPSYDIKVFGTSFNVSAYPDDDHVETVLVEGKVSVKGNDPQEAKKEFTLKPNQIFSYSKQSKKGHIRDVDVEYYTLWKDGMLKFDNADLSQIIKKIERLYDLNVVISNPSISKMKISGKLNLRTDSKEVFRYLSVLTKMNFEQINGKNYVLK